MAVHDEGATTFITVAHDTYLWMKPVKRHEFYEKTIQE